MARRIAGKISRLVADRGFGFIAADDGSEPFFHYSGLRPPTTFDDLRVGDAVQFTPVDNGKGPRGEDIARA